MILFNEWEISLWALNLAIIKKATKEVINLITDPCVAYVYCNFVKYDLNIKRRIPKDNWNYFEDNSYYNSKDKEWHLNSSYITKDVRFLSLCFCLDSKKVKDKIDG